MANSQHSLISERPVEIPVEKVFLPQILAKDLWDQFN